MNPELTTVCNRLLEALFNGGYQGLVVTGAVWLCLKALPRANAATRHLVWLVTLVFVAVLPAVHFLLPEPREAGASPQEDAGGPNRLSAGETEASDGYALLLQEIRSLTREIWIQRFGEENTPPSAQEIPTENPLIGKNSPPELDSKNAPSPTWFLPALPWSWRLPMPEWTSVVLIGLWVGLAAARLGTLIWQSCRLQILKSRGMAVPASLRALFDRLCGEMGVRRRTHLLASQESRTPVAVGFRQPAVLLPVRMFGRTDLPELEQVLRHELAHVSRRDDWTNFIQQSIKAVLFFHPAVWWLSRRLTVEREIACDDHVLAATRSPRSYALFLTEFAGQMQSRALPAALAAWSNKHQLEERINMILNSNRNSSPRLARVRALVLSAAAALVAILVLQAGPRLALAADPPAAADPAEAAVAKVQNDVAAVETLLAEIQEAQEPPGGGAESGPRPKARPVPVPQIAPVPAIVPHPPHAPHALVAPPVAVARPEPSAPATPPARARRSGDSIERRLERLEQLVESLLEREKGPKKGPDAARDFRFDMKMPRIEIPKIEVQKIEIPKFEFDQNKFGKMAEEHKKLAEKMHKFGPSEEELARIQEHAHREGERAQRDAERAVRDLERLKDGEHRVQIEERRAKDALSESRINLQKQRAELQAQRRSLERQMQALERKMQRLEERQHKAEEESTGREQGPKKRDPGSDAAEPEDSGRKDQPKAR